MRFRFVIVLSSLSLSSFSQDENVPLQPLGGFVVVNVVVVVCASESLWLVTAVTAGAPVFNKGILSLSSCPG